MENVLAVLKKWNAHLLYDPYVLLLGIFSGEIEDVYVNVHGNVHSSYISYSKKLQNTQCPSTDKMY